MMCVQFPPGRGQSPASGALRIASSRTGHVRGACQVFGVRPRMGHAGLTPGGVGPAVSARGVGGAFPGPDGPGLPLASPPMPGLINQRMSQPLLARGVVRHVGEAVAVVVTEGPDQGGDAAELIDVGYDLLPPVLDTDVAAAPRPESGTLLFSDSG